MSINRVNISGNLTRDSELRMTASGTPILNFGIAVNDRRKNQQTGEWEDVPNFVDCVLFGKRAESLADILRKGLKVSLEGKLRYSSWSTKDGQNRSKIEVAVDDIELMQQASRQVQQPAQRYVQQAPVYQQAPQPAPVYQQPQAQMQQMPQQQPQLQPQPQQYAQPQQQVQVQQHVVASDVYDEDIPF